MNTVVQIALYKYAKKTGRRVEDLSPAEITAVAAKTKGFVGSVKAAGEVIKAAVVVQVPLPIFEERNNRCRSNRCGHATIGRNEILICGICGCSGELMNIALRSSIESCRLPEGEKQWDEYKGPNDPGV